MAFTIEKDDIKKSQKCPPGIHKATLTLVEDVYYNEKGTEIQKCEFETEEGYIVPVWFNNKMLGPIIEFVEAADKVKLTEDTSVDLKKYEGTGKVCISVSHIKDKNNKIQAQIDNFFSADKVPF